MEENSIFDYIYDFDAWIESKWFKEWLNRANLDHQYPYS